MVFSGFLWPSPTFTSLFYRLFPHFSLLRWFSPALSCFPPAYIFLFYRLFPHFLLRKWFFPAFSCFYLAILPPISTLLASQVVFSCLILLSSCLSLPFLPPVFTFLAFQVVFSGLLLLLPRYFTACFHFSCFSSGFPMVHLLIKRIFISIFNHHSKYTFL